MRQVNSLTNYTNNAWSSIQSQVIEAKPRPKRQKITVPINEPLEITGELHYLMLQWNDLMIICS